MKPRYQFPNAVEDVDLRFFGRFTWKDLVRIGAPVATTLLFQNQPLPILLGVLIGLILYLVRPYNQPLDHHAYHLTRFLVEEWLK